MSKLKAILERTLPVRVLLYLSLNIFSLWLWWESYLDTVNWEMRTANFDLPFYIASIPHGLVVDLAILLIWLSSLLPCTELLYFALKRVE